MINWMNESEIEANVVETRLQSYPPNHDNTFLDHNLKVL